ncbi:MAG: amidohydrolase [Eubacteriaceae bacterium]|jgi:predicted amidohydrolase YtcJ|nr:amidohydrolase [Eubacteriaceae bacterium]
MKHAFINGSVITVDDNNSITEAILTENNRIVYTGTNAEVEKLAGKDAEFTDLNGRTLMPGLIDSHYHPILNGLLGPELDAAMIDTFYSNCKSLKEMLDMLRQAVALKKPGEWVSMMGYEPSFFPEKRHPTIEELDEIAPDNPVHCMHGGGHICMYNSKALEYLGVYGPDDASKYPQDEVEVIDGKLTGMVRGHTHFWLWGQVDYPEQAQAKAAMKSYKNLIENGITSIHDAGELDKPSYHIMQKLCRNRTFKVRSYMMLHSIFGKPFSKEDNECWMKLGLMSGLGDEYFKIGTCKFMIDGGSGGPSCYTREPYTHDPSLPREKGWERDEVAEYIKLINDAECQASAHAIGDGAVEFMIHGYEEAFKTNPRPDLRHRVEHCTLSDQELIDKMAKMNICPSVNVGMVAFQGSNYERFFGPERSKYICAIRSMLDAGVKCSFQSDAPSGPVGLALIDGAVNRYDRTKGVQCDRTQAVSVLEAIRCATINGAYGAYEENIKGSLECGKLADMIVLSDNILKIDPMDIGNLKVDMTIIDGNVEYVRK